MATAPIGPQAWKPPYAEGVAPERQKKKKKVYMALEDRTPLPRNPRLLATISNLGPFVLLAKHLGISD